MRFVSCLLALASPASAVIFYATADPAHNREVAPGGALAGSGWQFQGEFGVYSGTAISPNHFITAVHFGVPSSTFVSKGYYNGGSDVTYTVNTTAFAGVGYKDITGTDLRIYEINETFASYAPLYTGTDEVGKDLVVMGRGTQRGTTVTLSGDDIGWRWGTADNKARWGTNQVAATVALGGADYLYATFDAAAGGDEAHLSSGDSGGAVFIQDGGVWKLAGINYAVDGDWDYNGVADGNGFRAALYDARGMYVGSDADGWTLVEDEGAPEPSGFYSTRISTYYEDIALITGIPEPGPVVLLLLAALLGIGHRRR
ncbi:hypothetical protein [Haloferula sp. A504]|uniref:hypothetical protein n=1 Tax=Haloferula sp. A504 TaxID=3373601 RepID=UPI0031CB3759|nr:hypothetical protein [Verrucomicrobiaceae bacterium E54]